MNNKVKITLAFVAGAIAFNAPMAISNMPNTEEVLSRAMGTAMQSVADYQAEQEDKRLETLPNILDCQNMQWMKNCTEINKQAKKHPQAPLRTTNPDGIEFNFVPGTPSAVIRLQLEQTPEAAAAAVAYMDTTWGEYKKSAGLYQQAMWEAGKLENIIGVDEARKNTQSAKSIDTKNLSISVFVHSMCGACDVQLNTLSALQSRYPDLRITVFQFDNNSAGFAAKVTDRGLKGRMLSPSEAKNALAAGVERWPTTWIDNMPKRKRDTLNGVKSIVQLEERLLGNTHIITAGK